MSERLFHLFVNTSAGRLQSQSHRAKLMQEAQTRLGGSKFTEFSHQGKAIEPAVLEAQANGEVPVIVGGDGSISRLADALIRGTPPGSSAEFAILARGTGNDAARSLELPLGMVEGLERIRRAQAPRPIDALCVQVDGETIAHCLTQCSMGLAANVLRRADGLAALGAGKYAIGTLFSAFGDAPAAIKATYHTALGDFPAPPGWLVGLANGGFTGGGMKMVPNGRMDDGIAEAVCLHQCSPWRLLTLLAKVFSGAHVHDPKVSITAARQMSATLDQATAVVIDGEIVTVQGELTVKIVPNALKLWF